MRNARAIVLAGLVLVIALPLLGREGDVPLLTRHVTDLTGTLSPIFQERLEDRLRRFEDSTSIQIAVVILPSLAGLPAEEVSMSIFEKNRIGQKGKDNGILLMVALAERTVRIEVGYGLEGVLTDAQCALIIDRRIKPYFRQRRFYEGLDVGISAIISATEGSFVADEKPESRSSGTAFLVTMLLILFVSYRRLRRSTMGVGMWGGGWTSRSGWGMRGPWTGGGTFGGGGWSGGGGLGGGGGATGSW